MTAGPLVLILAALPLFLIVAIVVIVWALIPPGDRFLRGFAQLLSDAVIVRQRRSIVTGRFQVHGVFNGRDTSLRLQLKRRKRGEGTLVVSMWVDDQASLGYEAIERRIRDVPGREALFILAAERLAVELAHGWLTGEWRPRAAIVFPGAFVEEQWHRVLAAMDRVASAIESTAPSRAEPRVAGSDPAIPDPSAPRA